ncbi:MAG: hypothetical protein M3291_08875 [Actinomycetota bacterium]|nr:hypothetical protein [Actinomycetota bacterium]
MTGRPAPSTGSGTSVREAVRTTIGTTVGIGIIRTTVGIGAIIRATIGTAVGIGITGLTGRTLVGGPGGTGVRRTGTTRAAGGGDVLVVKCHAVSFGFVVASGRR